MVCGDKSDKSDGSDGSDNLPRISNPCFNGIWSARYSQVAQLVRTGIVLILVLMEYGLQGVEQFSFDMDSVWVLILVLMEYGLRD